MVRNWFRTPTNSVKNWRSKCVSSLSTLGFPVSTLPQLLFFLRGFGLLDHLQLAACPYLPFSFQLNSKAYIRAHVSCRKPKSKQPASFGDGLQFTVDSNGQRWVWLGSGLVFCHENPSISITERCSGASRNFMAPPSYVAEKNLWNRRRLSNYTAPARPHSSWDA